MQTPRLLIAKTGTTYSEIKARFGDFDDWFIKGISPSLSTTVIDLPAGESLGSVGDWDGILVTGSPAMVSDRADWSEYAAKWLKQAVAAGLPILGVCYGHQLLAHALGGDVGYHPKGRETGTRVVELSPQAEEDPLFRDLPRRFKAQLTHKQSVLRLPPEAILLGKSDFEPHQAFRVGDCAWGVQFHPEFSDAVMKAYLEVQTPELITEGLDAGKLVSEVAPAPEASSLLQRFSDLVVRRRR